jgi:hypothetical protein
MKARITIDGTNILTEATKEAARVALLAVAKTANPTAKKAVNGAKFFTDASNVASKLGTMGKSDSVVEFYEMPEGKTAEKIAAKYTLQNFCNRLVLSATADNYSGEIFADEKTAKDNSGKPEQERDI